jgi:chaperonin GroES
MSFRLLHDRIAVLADEIPETTESGLIISEAAQSPLRHGKVATVGQGHRSEHTNEPVALDVQEGDRIFFHRASGQPLEIEGIEYVILSNAEIIGIEQD